MPHAKTLDYQKALRDVAKSMVRLKRPERLLKMITRFIDKELGLTHTSLLILEEEKRRFIFVDSKGNRKFPVRLVKIDLDHPMVLWFLREKPYAGGEDYLHRENLDKWLAQGDQLASEDAEHLRQISRTMEDLKVELVVPSHYKEALIGFLLLGKKTNREPFTSPEISFFQILAQDCSMAVKNSEYYQKLVERNKELTGRLEEIENLRAKERKTYTQIMLSLAREVYVKDSYTYGHVNQVERLGMMTAREMGLDLSGRRSDILSAGLVLHDVGKIGIPDAILKKPGPLTPEEWKVMKTHVENGEKILEPLSDFQEVLEIVRAHHENFDGTGYPRCIKGEQIPLFARIVSVVDAFHAIVSTRCYSKGRTVEEAFRELRRCAGTQFDPVVVEAFVRSLSREMKKRGVDFFLDESTDGTLAQSA